MGTITKKIAAHCPHDKYGQCYNSLSEDEIIILAYEELLRKINSGNKIFGYCEMYQNFLDRISIERTEEVIKKEEEEFNKQWFFMLEKEKDLS